MLCYHGVRGYSGKRIGNYVKVNRLSVDERELGLHGFGSTTKYWIPKSNLVKIIKGMRIAVTERDLNDAASELFFEDF